MTHPIDLTLTRTIPAPRKSVFEAWLDKATLIKFMAGGAEVTCKQVENDPRVGGTFFILMRTPDRDVPHTGVYTAITPHERLAFTWLSPHAGPGSEVTLTFKELGPKETELTLHHTGFTTDAQRAGHEGGWGHCINHLVRALT